MPVNMISQKKGFGAAAPLPGQKGYKMKESQRLMDQTEQMQTRLAGLRDQLSREKEKRQENPLQKGGHRWKSARADRGSIRQYGNDVLAREGTVSSKRSSAKLPTAAELKAKGKTKGKPSKSKMIKKAHSSSADSKDLMASWTLAQVQHWLARIDLVQYQDVFTQNQIDGKTLAELTLEDLDYLNIKILSHRKKLLREIQHEQSSSDQLPLPVAIQDDKLFDPPEALSKEESKESKQHWSHVSPLSENQVPDIGATVPVNLADGQFDEDASHESFLRALTEWRTSDHAEAKDSNENLKSGKWTNPFNDEKHDEEEKTGGQLLTGTLDEDAEHEAFREAVEAWRNPGSSVANGGETSSGTQSSVKQSCWHCYHLFHEAQGIQGTTHGVDRWFCSTTCHDKET